MNMELLIVQTSLREKVIEKNQNYKIIGLIIAEVEDAHAILIVHVSCGSNLMHM